MTIRIGISGWRYAPWRGVFYPQGLPQRRELEYAARIFPTIEINGSFYSLQAPPSDARKASKLKPRKRRSRDIYCYFDNDAKVHAPFDAQNLAARLA